MNRREIAAILLAMLAALPSAFAKDPAPSTITRASGVELTQAVPKPPTPQKREAAPAPDADADADARHCLEFAANLEVIMCAEKYRSHKRNP